MASDLLQSLSLPLQTRRYMYTLRRARKHVIGRVISFIFEIMIAKCFFFPTEKFTVILFLISKYTYLCLSLLLNSMKGTSCIDFLFNFIFLLYKNLEVLSVFLRTHV